MFDGCWMLVEVYLCVVVFDVFDGCVELKLLVGVLFDKIVVLLDSVLGVVEMC